MSAARPAAPGEVWDRMDALRLTAGEFTEPLREVLDDKLRDQLLGAFERLDANGVTRRWA
jgi:hypothetical protein